MTTHGVLDGWKAALCDQSGRDGFGGNGCGEEMNLHDAIKQITALRKALLEREVEVEVLVEALDYARGIVPMADHNGPAVCAGLNDIKERKRCEHELLESREQLRESSAYMEAIREEERKRIAMEIHDELGPLLTALNMDISLLKMRLSGDSAAARNRRYARSG